MTLDLEFDDDGLLTVVAQDADTDEVLMVAHADRTAIERTLATGRAHYYSRSRDEYWQKGETSGHVQDVREVRVDCDGDAVLYRVDQTGGACHTGHRSCFYRRVDEDDDAMTAVVVEEPVFDPDEVYD
jgi:phosphoribosyl-AMP cyclohydrolase